MMTCVMNLSRLTDFHSDSGTDEGEAGRRRSDDGITGEGYVSSPLLTMSPSLSLVFDPAAFEGWDTTTSGYAQLSSATGDEGGSGGSNPAVQGSYFPTTSPNPERGESLNHSGDTGEPKKRYRSLKRDFDSRHRRVYGPVKGNNKSGKRGKLTCTQCRKIRSKVTLQPSIPQAPFCAV